jgi:hypothetical protein
MRTSRVAAAVLSIALVGVPALAPSPAVAGPSQYELYLAFNGKTNGSPNLKSSGSAAVTTGIASAGDGVVAAVRRKGAGRAARFEPFDPGTPARLAVVVVRPNGNDRLSPGNGAFAFGAAFKLDAKSQGSDVDDGNNLLQRGLYGDAAQYKIQIDGNRLSCRVKGSAGAVLVNASSKLAPGRWHRARCARNNNVVKLVLHERTKQGVKKRVWKRSGSIGSVAFSAGTPMSVGGKVNNSGEVLSSASDQFNGRVDNVFFRRNG